MNQLVRFQYRKQILPAYTAPLLPMLMDLKVENVEQDEKYYIYEKDKEKYRFVTHYQLERLSEIKMLPEGGIKVAIAAYIISDRRFKYQSGSKEAAELFCDVDGGRFKFVKWASKNNKLPPTFSEDLTGSIAILILDRWNDKKPGFSVDKLMVVSQPIGNFEENEEESP